MARRLAALEADLAAVNRLLEGRTQEADPIGWFQLDQRKQELRREMASLSVEPDSLASVALVFDGRPVLGSRGILASFAAQAIDRFQNLVDIRHAAVFSGSLAQR